MTQHNGPPIDATFKGEGADGKPFFTREPVVAWDDDGGALLADGSHRLRRADEFVNYTGLSVGDPPGQVIPGQGWLITFEGLDGDPDWTEPIVGWLIDSDGHGRPLATDGEGSVEPVRHGAQGFKVHHPDHP